MADDDIERDLALLRWKHALLQEDHDKLLKVLAVREARIVELEKALGFYANESNWSCERHLHETYGDAYDNGARARAALDHKEK